jgi:hypothetical protein
MPPTLITHLPWCRTSSDRRPTLLPELASVDTDRPHNETDCTATAPGG